LVTLRQSRSPLESAPDSGTVPSACFAGEGKPWRPAQVLYQFHTLDVFTADRFAGNQLAVLPAATGLTSARMQAIAKEFSISETVFVLPPDNPSHSAKLRIFTPGLEMPFAGHPTIGTAILLADLKGRLSPGMEEAIIVLEEAVGVVRVGVRRKAGEAAYAEFDAPKLPEPLSTPVLPDRMADALGVSPSEIGFENHRPTRYSAGVPYSFVPMRGLEAIARARMILPFWESAFGSHGAYLYCRETVHTTASFHARMFAPDLTNEDPATGSAAAAFSAAVHRFDDLKDGTRRMLIEQGYEMGRPSEINLEVTVAGGQLRQVRIGGRAVRVSSGTIEV
jgi:trans-2,3-dihydro-3-hydroxyanthranilate isomerase